MYRRIYSCLCSDRNHITKGKSIAIIIRWILLKQSLLREIFLALEYIHYQDTLTKVTLFSPTLSTIYSIDEKKNSSECKKIS